MGVTSWPDIRIVVRLFRRAAHQGQTKANARYPAAGHRPQTGSDISSRRRVDVDETCPSYDRIPPAGRSGVVVMKRA